MTFSLEEHDASLCCEELASSILELVGKHEESKARGVDKTLKFFAKGRSAWRRRSKAGRATI